MALAFSFWIYIDVDDAMSVPMAIALSGLPFLGQPVMVKPSEAEKNLVQSTTTVTSAAGGFIGSYSGGATKGCILGICITTLPKQIFIR